MSTSSYVSGPLAWILGEGETLKDSASLFNVVTLVGEGWYGVSIGGELSQSL